MRFEYSLIANSRKAPGRSTIRAPIDERSESIEVTFAFAHVTLAVLLTLRVAVLATSGMDRATSPFHPTRVGRLTKLRGRVFPVCLSYS